MRSLRLLLVAALAATGIAAFTAAPAGAAVPAALTTFDQCQNQAPAPYTTCSGWTNGGINNSNHYAEDMVVPQRASFATTPGTDYTFSVTYDNINGTKHGYDFLATYNYSITGASPCQAPLSASLCSGTPSTLNMASDPTVQGGSAISSHELPQANRQWTLYGGTLVSTTAPTHSGNQATTTVTFHSNPGVTTVVLLFGGHLAVGTPSTALRSWGNGNGASSYPGGSLSIRQTGSSRNNGIQTNAIAPLPAAAFTIAKTASPTTGAAPGGPVSYTVTVTNTGGVAGDVTFTDDYDNNLTNVTTPAGCTQGTGSMTCTATALAAGASRTFTYTANLPSTFTGTGTCTGGAFAVQNTATLASGTNVTAGTTGSVTATVCVTAAPSFSVTKTPRSTTAAAGGQVIYDVVVHNGGT
ncbi:MAG: hypothetical protein JWR52_3120, partial [Marmoricola sp.]|nr:hypothetical protein [Marmoricola sp.]